MDELELLLQQNQKLMTPDPVTGTPTGAEPVAMPAQGTAAPSDIDALIAQNQQAMQPAQATQPVQTGPKQALLPDGTPDPNQPQDYGPAMNVVAGFNRRFAEIVGLPEDIIASGLNKAGLLDLDPNNPRQGAQRIFKAFRGMGINIDPIEGLAKQIGEEAFVTAVTGGALQAAAKSMVAAGSGSANAVMKVVGEMGEQMIRNPYLAQFIDQSASAGGVVGQQVTGSPLGALPGAIGGGVLATGAAGLLRAADGATDALTRGGKKVVSNMTGGMLGHNPAASVPAGAPLRTFGDAAGDSVQPFVQQNVEGARIQAEMSIQNVLDNIGSRNLTPEQAQVAVREGLEGAEKIVNRIENQHWSEVPNHLRVPMRDAQAAIRQMNVELRDKPSVRPSDQMRELYQLGSPVRGPDGKMVKMEPTIQRLRDFKGSLRRERLNEEGKARIGLTPNWEKAAQIGRLESIIDDAIQTAHPTITSIQNARAVSVIYNNLFSRSGVANVLAKSASGADKVDAEQTVTHLMRKYGGLQDVIDIVQQGSRMPRSNRQPNTSQTASTPQDRRHFQTLLTDTEAALRQMVREQGEKFGATTQNADNVVRYIRRVEPQVKALTRYSAEMEQLGERLTTMRAQQNAIEQSAAARFSNRNPTQATASIWTSPDPRAANREIVDLVRGNRDALEGHRNNMIDHFLKQGKGDGVLMEELLSKKHIRDMMEDTLEPDQMTRLTKIIKIAARLSRGDEELVRDKAFMGPGKMLYKVVGAAVGRHVAHMTGGGSVQIPGLMSGAFGRAFDRTFRGLDPNVLLGMAIKDPKWERMLLDREPKSTKDWRKTIARYRSVVSVGEGLRQAAFTDNTGNEDE